MQIQSIPDYFVSNDTFPITEADLAILKSKIETLEKQRAAHKLLSYFDKGVASITVSTGGWDASSSPPLVLTYTCEGDDAREYRDEVLPIHAPDGTPTASEIEQMVPLRLLYQEIWRFGDEMTVEDAEDFLRLVYGPFYEQYRHERAQLDIEAALANESGPITQKPRVKF